MFPILVALMLAILFGFVTDSEPRERYKVGTVILAIKTAFVLRSPKIDLPSQKLWLLRPPLQYEAALITVRPVVIPSSRKP